ncbi:MAG: DUF554 domain-containing protein [Motilibacteraceae bacterium]
MFVGAGTALNVATVLVGSSIGVALGSRLPERTREVVTDALGLVTLLIAALSAFDVRSAALAAEVGSSAPVLIVLGSLLIGGIIGSLLGLEARLEGVGGWLQRALTGRRSASSDGQLSDGPGTLAAEANPARARFVEGFVTASLVFCVGPLTILGSLSDGLGRGIDQLALKATLDGFASIAFAASLGWGVAASALAVAVIQGALTLLGVALGDVLPEAHVAALTATGGLVLVGVALRLLRIRQVPAADLLPALVVAPVLVWVVAGFR